MVIPIIGVVPLIPNAMVQPMGLAKQWTLNEKGNRKIKYRITQDLLYLQTNKDAPCRSTVGSTWTSTRRWSTDGLSQESSTSSWR